MSGAGALTLVGGGLIGNVNAGSISGGTLEGSPSGELIVFTPQALVIGSVIANNGGATALTKAGSNTLVLTGINTYTGLTTIGAGQLQIGNGSSGGLGSLGAVFDNGTLAFDLPASATFNGLISGAGGVSQMGANTLTLGNANRFTGVTSISSGGTLQVGDGTPIGTTSMVNDNGTLAFSQTDNSTFSPYLTGAGNLIKAGTGTLTLVGATSYSGSTTVSAGTLQLGNGVGVGSSNLYGTVSLSSGAALVFNSGGSALCGGAVVGAGSLTQAGTGILSLVGNNTYTGGTTISAGTLELTGGSIAGNVTDNGTLAFGLAGAATFGGVITGSGGLMQAGGGTLTLSASNGFSGGTNVYNGTLQVTSSGALGSGPVADNSMLVFNVPSNCTYGGQISGIGSLIQASANCLTLTASNTFQYTTTISAGTLQVGNGGSGEYLASQGVSNNGTLAFNHSDALTYGGAISGAGNLLKLGTGLLTLTGYDYYTGTTTISAGTLQVMVSGYLNNSLIGPVVDNSLFLNSSSANCVISGLISGSGSLNQAGPGLLTLSSNNTYSGGTTISGGTLQLGNGSSSGNIAGNVTDNGTLAFDIAGAATFGGTISGSGGVMQNSAGTVSLTAANSFTGPTAILNGSLSLNNANAVQDSTVTVYQNNGLLLSGATTFNLGSLAGSGNIVTTTGQALNVGGDNASTTYAGSLSGAGSLSKSGSGILTLTGSNTDNGTTLAAGELSISASYNLPTSGQLVFNGGTLQITGMALTTLPYANVNWSSFNGGFDIANAGNTFTLANAISGAGKLGKAGLGTLVLTTANSYSGGTTIGAGMLELTGSATLGSGPVTDNGTLEFNLSGASNTFSPVISGSGGLVQAGTGALTLTGSDTFTGPTTITAGTLQVGNGGAGEFLGSQTVSIASNSALVFSHSDATTYAGAISGAGNLVQIGAGGNLVLTGSNTYIGNTFVSSGTLQIGDGDERRVPRQPNDQQQRRTGLQPCRLADLQRRDQRPRQPDQDGHGHPHPGGRQHLYWQHDPCGGRIERFLHRQSAHRRPIVFSGGFLQVAGTAMTSMAGYGSVNWSSFNGGFDIANAANTFTLSSPISGGGSLGDLGPGTLLVTAFNTYTGGTTIGAGVLQVSGSGTLGSGPVADSGTLVYSLRAVRRPSPQRSAAAAA